MAIISTVGTSFHQRNSGQADVLVGLEVLAPARKQWWTKFRPTTSESFTCPSRRATSRPATPVPAGNQTRTIAGHDTAHQAALHDLEGLALPRSFSASA